MHSDRLISDEFSRNIGLLSESDQKKLLASRVGVAGAGGVGGLHVITLARLGIGRFTISDPDTFEAVNINRQFGALRSTLGRNTAEVPASVSSGLEMSYAGAQAVAQQYPQYATQITAAAKTAFLDGDQSAYIAGILAVLIGAAIVFFVFPKRDEERKVLVEYHQKDMAAIAEMMAKEKAVPTPASGK